MNIMYKYKYIYIYASPNNNARHKVLENIKNNNGVYNMEKT